MVIILVFHFYRHLESTPSHRLNFIIISFSSHFVFSSSSHVSWGIYYYYYPYYYYCYVWQMLNALHSLNYCTWTKAINWQTEGKQGQGIWNDVI
jgi:hypothetical protein